MNKKGFELAMNTMVIVILAIIFLVAMIVIFNYQTGFFSSMLRNFSGKSNVDAVVIACNSLVNQQANYEYCCVSKDIAMGKENLNMTCSEMAGKSYGNGISKMSCENVGCE